MNTKKQDSRSQFPLPPLSYPEELPISRYREEIIRLLAGHQVLIVAGEPGSGKTTQLPKMCLEAGLGEKGWIGCTQPRRIAALSVAERVASEIGPQGKVLVASRIRFRDSTRPTTRIKFMTDGILLAEAQQDREFSRYQTIIVDEAHERSLNIDFLLGLLKQLLPRRPDLKVIITSATIDTAKFARHFGNAPVVQVEGRGYPVAIRYRPVDHQREEEGESTYVDQAVEAVLELHQEEKAGDILVFMPTERDIRETVELIEARLRDISAKRPATVLPLFGRLAPSVQQRIFGEVPGRKIVVATNVAETSITVPGIRYVVDTGLARLSVYNPRARTRKLPVLPVSKASCDQRAGRCGRTAPGVCIRLYSEEEYDSRPEFTPPEIVRSNLAEVILRMKGLGLGEPAEFPFVDPPSARAIRDGINLLLELGGLDKQGRLTRTGRIMARLPLDPRLSRMIVQAREENSLREVTVIAAALSIQDPRVRPPEKEAEADQAHARFGNPDSDFMWYVNAWEGFVQALGRGKGRKGLTGFLKGHHLSYVRMREWADIHEQIVEHLKRERGFHENVSPASYAAIHRALLSGFARNIAMKKEKGLYLGPGGREVAIFPGSFLHKKGGPWIMAAEFLETSRLFARTVANIEPEWLESLFPHLCLRQYGEPFWEKRGGRVVAREKVSLFGLPVVSGRRVDYGRIDPEEARKIFIHSGLVEGELSGNYPFLDHNQKLMEELSELEERTRRRGIVADDQVIFRLYDQRLPKDVRDRQSLNRFLKRRENRENLMFSREELLAAVPEADELSGFPPALSVAGLKLPLVYRFAPGSDEDGVTVQVPPHLAGQLPPEPFEWLVPGLLLEKITFLLKGLPKAVRKHLVPIPATAEEFHRLLEQSARERTKSLYAELARLIEQRAVVKIEPSMWPELPPHLSFRYCLVDALGRELASGRNLAALAGKTAPVKEGEPARGVRELKKRWEREKITPEVLRDLPERIEVRGPRGRLGGWLYPGLVQETGGVSVRLFDSEEERDLSTVNGLLGLYRQRFSRQIKQCGAELSFDRRHWGLLAGLGQAGALDQGLSRFLLATVFGVAPGPPPSFEEFQEQAARVEKTGLYPLVAPLKSQVVQLLGQRKQVMEEISRLPRGATRTLLEQELSRLLPPTFLEGLTPSRLENLGRYLKALAVRAQRALADPAKDAAKEKRLRPFVERLREAEARQDVSKRYHDLLEEYRQMVEEFKVSLFAPELKTAFPVSEKRLGAKFEELCRSVSPEGFIAGR